MRDNKQRTPYTWNPGSPCGGCGLTGRLLCKWDGRVLRAVLALGLSFTAYEYVSRLF